jgi:hypothetical protein
MKFLVEKGLYILASHKNKSYVLSFVLISLYLFLQENWFLFEHTKSKWKLAAKYRS